MKTLWTETQQLEIYWNQKSGEETSVQEARLILDASLREKLLWQKHAYAVVKEYGRQQLKAELEKVHQKLFRRTSFREKILQLFSKPY